MFGVKISRTRRVRGIGRFAIRYFADEADKKKSGSSWMPVGLLALAGSGGYYYAMNKDTIKFPDLPTFSSGPAPAPVASLTPVESDPSGEVVHFNKHHSPDQSQVSVIQKKDDLSIEQKVKHPVENKQDPVHAEKQELIPTEIIKDSSLIELFSEALGQSEESTNQSGNMKDLLGKEKDVEVLGGKLLASAVRETVEGQPNWEEFKARRKQTFHDASIFKAILNQQQEDHESKLVSLQKKLDVSQEKVQSLEKQVKDFQSDLDSRVKTQVKKVEDKHKLMLRKVRDKTSLEAAEKAMKERSGRLQQMDQLRENINSLALGFSYWQKQSEALTQAQRTVLETSTMDHLLHQKPEINLSLTELGKLPVNDPFLQMVMGCAPKGRVPTKLELQKDLEKLRMTLEPNALLPASGGGLLSQLVATIGCKLKFKVTDLENGVEDLSGRFDQIEQDLEEGSIMKAILQLAEVTRGSKGVHLAEKWITEAKKYATFQEMDKMVLARGQELTMSISQL